MKENNFTSDIESVIDIRRQQNTRRESESESEIEKEFYIDMINLRQYE